MRRTIAGLAALVALGGAPPASASFHLVSVSEVAPNPAGAQSAFIELQMYEAGQTQFAGHSVSVYDADGGVPVTSFALSANAQNGETQRTFLIGDDLTPGGPDFVNSQLADPLGPLGPGGAVCFDTVDCVSWGSFTGTALPSPPGSPAAAIPPGSSLTRSIAPGCATLLEADDDTDDSATDFALVAPSPRPNSVAPTEKACGPGGGDDDKAPETEITKAPKKKSEKHKAKFKFTASEPGSSFECKLDRKPYKPCTSPRTVKRLDDGKHKFQVRATDEAGNTDSSPAKAKFKVLD